MIRRLALAVLLLPVALGAQRIKLPASLSDLQARALKDSDDAAAQYNVALAYWNAQRWNDADSAFHRAIHLDPRFAPAYVGLAYLPYAERSSLGNEVVEQEVPADWKPKVKDSDEMLSRALIIDPLSDMRLAGAVRVSSQAAQEYLKEWYGEWLADYEEGRDYYYNGDFEKAYNDFTRVTRDIRGEIPTVLLYFHGLSAAQIGKNDEALADFESLRDRLQGEEHRDSTLHIPLKTNDYRYIVGVMQERLGKLNDAIDSYREAARNDLGLFMAHVHLANMYEQHAMWPQAIRERQEAANANPDDPSLQLDLGETFAQAGQWQDAEKALKDAQTGNPRDARVPYYLGVVEMQLNDKDDARNALSRFIAIAPSRYERQVADAKKRLDSLH
ncbi:MAG TPA: tetratricopeptide repeat protein [Gemmatimonadales bacterium]|nr:tetratricopeptide repeat protein [Gemmatimonadales bacterium]